MLFDIIEKDSCEINKDAKKDINKILFENSIKSIIIGFDMVKYLPKIINIIGDDYKRIISAIDDCNSGCIKFITSVGKNYEIKFIEKVSKINTLNLDRSILIDNPSYLIMNNNTLTILSNSNPDEIDKYLMNNNAYYHSYYKVPIAICEFLETGKIETMPKTIIPV